MRTKILIIATIVFFLLINTTYYWERNLGALAMLTSLLLIFWFLALVFIFFWQLYLLIKEKFADRRRVFLVTFMTLILILSFLYPTGIIDYEKFESKVILLAQREGVANCMLTLKLKENGMFNLREICFGSTETIGSFRLSQDTIYFKSSSVGNDQSSLEFAVLQNKSQGDKMNKGVLILFRGSKTSGIPLGILKNELK